MMLIQQTTRLEMATRFINSTDSHLFLTGKAGTGKTTFLRQLANETHKSYLIVAPTGIAALNAGGVTIHSQFLLPFGSFIPEREPVTDLSDTARFYTKHTLTRVHTLNSMRRKVLRATDLVIIDEVSMLRADILDAIDFRLRGAKGNYARSFGGAQLLMIGDLHQLPPIVNDEEWQLLQKYYRSMHFFEAQALREQKMVYIELDRIFRQHDDRFIRILNNLRDNKATKEDIAILNSRYQSQKQIGTEQEAITITTHNYIADNINRRKLEALPGDPVSFKAEIYGDFPENLYPLPLEIELKEGARVMFVKNDSSEEKSYVNGQLAQIDFIEDEEIMVTMSDTGKEYTLRKEVWENKKYIVDEDTKEVEEEIIGTFEQYPVKPAWAVTVHKSQGLTFKEAVIDVGKAFAPGQVYVALSRMQSLEGLILRTRINPSAIMNDRDVLKFSGSMGQQKPLRELLHERQRSYMEQILGGTFDFSRFTNQLEYLQRSMAEKLKFEDDEGMEKAVDILLKRFRDEEKNTTVFRRQLQRLLRQNNRKLLLDRIAKGSEYYSVFMHENLKKLLFHLAEVMRRTRTKTYRNALSEMDQQIVIAMGKIEQAENIIDSILSNRVIKLDKSVQEGLIEDRAELWEMALRAAKQKTGSGSGKLGREGRKKVKLKKGETVRITWSMIKEGKSIKEVAEKRNLAVSTIERHIVRGISEGALDIFTVMQKEKVKAMAELLTDSSDTIGDLYKSQKGKYTHGELHMVRAFMEKNAVP